MRDFKRRSVASMTLAALMLASCGSEGQNISTGPITVTPTPTPTPTSGCSPTERKAFAKAVIDEWYLFPNDVASGVNPASHATVGSYIDALVAPARALGKDRYFTYQTSIAEENAFYASGSSAGLGFRMAYDSAAQQLVITESDEGAPALAAGIDRGARILAIGTNSGNIRTIASIFAAEGIDGVSNALGPSDPGVTRILRISDAAGTRDVTVTKANYALDPISDRYGAKIISEGGRDYGYLNLRSFISSADPQLRTAFANFRAQGVTDVVIDFRYNGGGLVSTAELMGDLLGRNRTSSEIFSQTNFRPSKSVENERRFFATVPESIAPTRIAFIGTDSTASASELVINSMQPYLGTNMTLVGSNTYGKPVGQIGLDKAACDDRIRVVAFATANASGAADYYSGLAPRIANSCAASDDLTFPLGDPREASVRAAIDFLAGRSCTTRIGAATIGATASRGAVGAPVAPEMLVPERPSAAQRELPGLF